MTFNFDYNSSSSRVYTFFSKTDDIVDTIEFLIYDKDELKYSISIPNYSISDRYLQIRITTIYDRPETINNFYGLDNGCWYNYKAYKYIEIDGPEPPITPAGNLIDEGQIFVGDIKNLKSVNNIYYEK